MATAKQLRARWNQPDGTEIQRALFAALRPLTSHRALVPLTAGLPFADEVAPALDLRGIALESVVLYKLVLTGARFDHATLRSNFVECRLTGAVFDGAVAKNVLFDGELARCSFVAAQLNRADFRASPLDEADFSRARLMGARLVDQSLRGARFASADLRTAELARSDISGADLTGADASQATFGEVRFDAATRVAGCRFSQGYVSPDFEAFVRSQGATILGSREGEGSREIDATIAVLQARYPDGSRAGLVARLREIRERVEREPGWDWLGELQRELPGQGEVVAAAFEEAVRHIEHYLT